MKGQVSKACVGFFRWGGGGGVGGGGGGGGGAWLGELPHLAILPVHCHFILFITFS